MDSPFNGGTVAKIVDPVVLINSLDRKFKAWLSSYQVAVFSKTIALQKFFVDSETDVLSAFILEAIDMSGSVGGKNVEGYIKVANTRVSVEDRKRKMELEQNTI